MIFPAAPAAPVVRPRGSDSVGQVAHSGR